jgi:hypothetical protein
MMPEKTPPLYTISHKTRGGAAAVFARDVQPIFKEHCIGCHGPTSSGTGSGWTGAAMPCWAARWPRSALGTAPQPIVPAAHRHTIRHANAPDRSLSAAQIETIKLWIDQGAEWPDAFSGETPAPPPDAAAVRLMTALRNTGKPNGDLAGVNHKGIHGSTPLMYAVIYSDAATVRLFLEKGADPNIRNDVAPRR